MKNKRFIKIISIIAVFCFALSASVPEGFVFADNKQQTSLEQQRDELKRKLLVTDQKLKEVGRQSKETEEYIQVLGEKIDYLNQQYKLARQEADRIEAKVNSLEKNISSNEREIAEMNTEIKQLEKDIVVLNKEFKGTYDDYCKRMRAIYISGQQGTMLTFLLLSDGVTNLLTRLQMINAVSKRDGELLQKVQTESTEIIQTKEKLSKKTESLKASQTKLKTTKTKLKQEREELLKSQDEMAAQQAVIETQQEEQNKILKELHKKTKEYGEFRDITQSELDEIDEDIEAAAKKYQPPTTTTTTTKKRTTTTTTTKKSTTGTSGSSSGKTTASTTRKTTTSTTKKTTTTTTKSSSKNYINLTYPCPRYTRITCGFGAYAGHTGCDFSTGGNENQKIVAAESGTVILVRLLERSYGHYIVIMHDKTTSSGKVVYTLYAHNNDILVSEGQHVSRGQQIARSGSTGNSTGPHCHFEVRVGGSGQSFAQNPANYL